jgi:hypothetical protein
MFVKNKPKVDVIKANAEAAEIKAKELITK